MRRHASSTLFPYTTLFRSPAVHASAALCRDRGAGTGAARGGGGSRRLAVARFLERYPAAFHARHRCRIASDRKSTRLNSSHVAISYAVFCLKKKNNKPIIH